MDVERTALVGLLMELEYLQRGLDINLGIKRLNRGLTRQFVISLEETGQVGNSNRRECED
jgi:hypothetical protein